MEWIAFIIMLFVGFDNNRSAFAPNESFFYGFGGEPIACKQLSNLENIQKGHVQTGKLSGYSNSGESICRKDIFTAKDRDQYFNLIASASQSRSAAITSKIASLLDAEKGENNLIYIDTSAINDFQIARYIYHVFSESITNSDIDATIIRTKSQHSDFRILKLEIAPTIHKEEIIFAKLTSPIKKTEQISKWVVL